MNDAVSLPIIADWHRRMSQGHSDQGPEWMAREMIACPHRAMVAYLDRFADYRDLEDMAQEIGRLKQSLAIREIELAQAMVREARTQRFLREAQIALGVLPPEPGHTSYRPRRVRRPRWTERLSRWISGTRMATGPTDSL